MTDKILIACEESQTVCKAFREQGIRAYSCDILDPSGDKPKWHFKCPVEDILDEDWLSIIAFPPCTDLAVSGAPSFEAKRKDGRQQRSIEFFMMFANHPAPFKAIENPVGIMSTVYRKPDQIIQPYEFGHPTTKKNVFVAIQFT